METYRETRFYQIRIKNPFTSCIVAGRSCVGSPFNNIKWQLINTIEELEE